MRKLLPTISILILVIFYCNTRVQAQLGCTDVQASNYNNQATINDGSCVYPATNLSLTTKFNLSTPTLDENSGLIVSNGQLWMHNDGGNSNALYRIDTTNGNILQTVLVNNATNIDWEDITQSPTHLYIGDIGNNSGSRTNLCIYVIDKNDLHPNVGSVTAQIINYSYSDQTNFVPATNNTNFDAEALLYFDNSLHVFSKNWIDKKCKHYMLPTIAGTYQAQLIETLNAGYLVTGACMQQAGVIALCGYDNTGIAPVYLTLLFDYTSHNFFSGNKRRFNVSNALTHGQVEAIDFNGMGYGWVSNERFQQSIFNVAPKLKQFNISSYLPASLLQPKATAALTVSAQALCKNKEVTFTSISDNAAQLQWIFEGGLPSNSTSSQQMVQYKTPGSYDVTLIASNGFKADTLHLKDYITVKTLPQINISAAGGTTFCTGGVLLMATSTNATYYQWRKNNKPITGAIGSNFIATESGNYTATAYHTNGCSKLSNSINVTGPPAATASVTGNLNICPPDSVIITANEANMSYQWLRNGNALPGETQQSLVVKNIGRYKVKVSNIAGCEVTTPQKQVTSNCRWGNAVKNKNLVFPNPSNTYFSVNLNILPSKCLNIKVFDIMGNQIEIINLDNTATWPIFGSHFKQGMYVLLITSETETQCCRIYKF